MLTSRAHDAGGVGGRVGWSDRRSSGRSSGRSRRRGWVRGWGSRGRGRNPSRAVGVRRVALGDGDSLGQSRGGGGGTLLGRHANGGADGHNGQDASKLHLRFQQQRNALECLRSLVIPG